MSRNTRVTELEVENAALRADLAKWKQDYKDLAMAMARGQGYSAADPGLLAVHGRIVDPPEGATFSALATLPGNVYAAVSETTEPFTEARIFAIDAARELLAQGMKPEDVEAELRKGEEIKI